MSRYQRLQRAIESAERALNANVLSELEAAAENLAEAYREADDSPAVPVAVQLLDEIRAARSKLLPAREIDTHACRICAGGEFLRSLHPVSMNRLEDFIDLELEVLICRACGDVRFVADPKKALHASMGLGTPAFERVVKKRPPGGPLR